MIALEPMQCEGTEKTTPYTVEFKLTSPDLQFLEIPERLKWQFPMVEVLQHTNTTLICKVFAVSLCPLKEHLFNIIEPNEYRSGLRCGYTEDERERFYDKIASIIVTSQEGEEYLLYQEDSGYRNTHYLVKVSLHAGWEEEGRYKAYHWSLLRYLQEELDNVYTDPDEYDPLFPMDKVDSQQTYCVFHTDTRYIGEKDKVAFICDAIQKAVSRQISPNAVAEIVIRQVERLYTKLTFQQDCSDADKETANRWVEDHIYGDPCNGYIELYESGAPYFTRNPPVTLAQTRQAREAVIKDWMMEHLPMIKEIWVMLHI